MYILVYYFKLNAMNLSNSVELSLGTQFILYYSTDLTYQIPTTTPCSACSHKIKFKLLFGTLYDVSWAKNENKKNIHKNDERKMASMIKIT